MLEVRNLVKKYGDKTAINGLSFRIGPGEIVGLLGLNGAGKSTTMNCITGYIAPTKGSITVDGHDILKEPDQAKRVIGYLPEVFSFYPDMKVWEYLDFVCDLKGFPKNKQARKEHIGTVCRQTGIDKLTGRMIRNLSKGYRQRVGFAQALIGNPKVLILDEPTVGLDPSQIMEIRQLIRDAGKESTVIVSSHILSEIQAICSRILVIHRGTIAADGTPEELLANASARAELSVRIKGSPEQIEAVLRSLNGIASFTHAKSPEEGAEEYLLTKGNAAAASPAMENAKEQPGTGNGSADLREQVFLAFAEAGLPILELSSREATLEQVFLHLTEQDPSVPKQENASAQDRTSMPASGAGGLKKGGEAHGSDL